MSERHAWTWNIKEEFLDEYVEIHKSVWPEVLEEHRKSGIYDYSIFRNGNQFFYCFKSENVDESFKYIGRSEICSKWNSITSKMVENNFDFENDENLTLLEEIFYLEQDMNEDNIGSRIIDLSMDIYDKAPTMPMDPKCSVVEHSNLDTLGYNITRLTLSTHQGTHLDAPFHFFYDGITVDRLDLNKCIGNAVRIDLTHKKKKEAITPDDFEPYKDRIQKGAFIICHTGWDKVYPKAEYFSEFPSFSQELAEWLVEKEAALIGMDTPTPNAVDWKSVHETLLGAGIVIVEGLTNLERLSSDYFTFICFPLKIQGRDGSPVRAVAIEGDNRLI